MNKTSSFSSLYIFHGLVEACMEALPVIVRVALSTAFTVSHFTLHLINTLFTQCDFHIAGDSTIFDEDILKGLGVHLFNFSLHGHSVFFVPSASAVLNFNLVFTVCVPHSFLRSRTSSKNSAHLNLNFLYFY